MIEVKNLSKHYEGVAVVDRINFTIEEGKTMILLGTSGCGKTTTMKMINRLVTPTNGEVWINGTNVINQDPEQLRRKIGYVIQSSGLFPHYTVGQNIGLVPSLLKWPDVQILERTKELMTLIGLDVTLLDRYPHELSGGQQQRVGLARALAADPALVLMDEPFGALDPITKQQILQEFLTLEALKSKTMLMVTHDVFEAVTLGDSICLMDKGKVQQLGTPYDLIFRPANSFVKEFFDSQRFRLELQVVKLGEVARIVEDYNRKKLPTHEAVQLPEYTSLLDTLETLEEKGARGVTILTASEDNTFDITLSREALLEHFYKIKDKNSY